MNEFLKKYYLLAILYWVSFVSIFIIPIYQVPVILKAVPILFVGIASLMIRNIKPQPNIVWWKGVLYFVALPLLLGIAIINYH